jgi:hypothetical protein
MPILTPKSPELTGNFGSWVNQKNEAWGKKKDETLTNNDIIIYLRGVFERHIKAEGAK